MKFVLIPIFLLVGILFIPIPYYLNQNAQCKLGSTNCPSKGWHLGPSLWSTYIFPNYTTDKPSESNLPQPTSTNNLDETANWEVYTDTKYNFQISYPQSWRTSIETYPEYNHSEYSDYYVVHLDSLDAGGISKGFGKSASPTYSLRITIYVKKEIITSLAEEAKQSGSEAPQCTVDSMDSTEGSPCEPIHPKEIIKKSDNHFKEFYSVVTANNLRHTIFPIPNNPKSFVDISTWYTWPKDDFEIYDKIISTFKFLDQNSIEKVIMGAVLENNLGCTVDNACYLRLLVDQEEIRVIYHSGEWPPCPNTKASNQGLKIREGEKVEVFGKYEESGNIKIISTCDLEAYYIKRL